MLVERGRRPKRELRDYSTAEKFAGVDGIILVDIIPIIGSSLISLDIEIGGNYARRRRRNVPGKRFND